MITTGPTDWMNTSTLIIPNFGDYTDNATSGTTTYYTWSDGRLGVPQPFVDSSPDGAQPQRARARSSTASSISGVSLPVKVFCWLGWKQPSSL